MANKWHVLGYHGDCSEAPDAYQEYDGFDRNSKDGVPYAPLKHMRAMVEKDPNRVTCTFAEVVDTDITINIQGDPENGIPNERKYKTVRCMERE